MHDKAYRLENSVAAYTLAYERHKSTWPHLNKQLPSTSLFSRMPSVINHFQHQTLSPCLLEIVS